MPGCKNNGERAILPSLRRIRFGRTRTAADVQTEPPPWPERRVWVDRPGSLNPPFTCPFSSPTVLLGFSLSLDCALYLALRLTGKPVGSYLDSRARTAGAASKSKAIKSFFSACTAGDRRTDRSASCLAVAYCPSFPFSLSLWLFFLLCVPPFYLFFSIPGARAT